jgi:hypothetical protein
MTVGWVVAVISGRANKKSGVVNLFASPWDKGRLQEDRKRIDERLMERRKRVLFI